MYTKNTIHRTYARGFTLIELLIAIGILAVLAGIAIPAYQGYVAQSRVSAARANAEPLRLALENYWLDNGDFGANGSHWQYDPANGVDTIPAALGWRPTNDDGNYVYDIDVTNVSGVSTYNVTVTHLNGGSITISGTR